MRPRIVFFANGNTMAFNRFGKQMPKLQESWFLLFLEVVKAEGFRPEDVDFELPNGMKAEPFSIGNGDYNWRVVG